MMEGRKLKLSIYEIITSTSLLNISRKEGDEEKKEQNNGPGKPLASKYF